MFNSTETLSADPFGSALDALGFGKENREDDVFSDKVEIDNKAIDLLNNASQQERKLTNTGSDKDDLLNTNKELAELPDFMKQHEEILNKKFEFEGDDNTDYTSLAIEQFGPSFSYIKGKDAFYDQMIRANTVQQELAANENYHKIVSYLETPDNDEALVKESILSRMRTHMTYTPKNYEDQLDQVFEEGKLNAEGVQLAKNLRKELAGSRSKIENAANQAAAKTLVEYKEYKNTFEDRIKNFNPFGFELSDDLRRHLREFVNSGKHNEVDSSKLSVTDRVDREILQALITSPKAAIEFINLVTKKGIDHGAQKVLKKTF